jgi:hypothetical protein
VLRRKRRSGRLEIGLVMFGSSVPPSTAGLNELDLFSSEGLCIGVERPHW